MDNDPREDLPVTLDFGEWIQLIGAAAIAEALLDELGSDDPNLTDGIIDDVKEQMTERMVERQQAIQEDDEDGG